MEYSVVLKNSYARAEVIALIASGIPFLSSYPFSCGQAFSPGSANTGTFDLLRVMDGFGPRHVSRFENASAAVYDKSTRGGTDLDYFDFGGGKVLVYDHRIRYAYWQQPIQTAQAKLTTQDYADAARDLGIEPELIMAIARQESHGNGFLDDNRPAILFERHKMHHYLKSDGLKTAALAALAKDNPELVNPKRTPKKEYGGPALQHSKLAQARALDESAALQSVSWGRFQIMGENYRYLYKTPQEMEKAMRTSEKQQLLFFVAFLRKKGGGKLLKALKAHQWERVAHYYNGGEWKEQNPNYAHNIQKYYEAAKKESVKNKPGLNPVTGR